MKSQDTSVSTCALYTSCPWTAGQQVQPAALAISGPHQVHPNLASSSRVVADYTGPGQLQGGPSGSLRPGTSFSQPEYSQQGPSQGLGTQQVQTGNPGSQMARISPAGGYPLHSQGKIRKRILACEYDLQ